jgi:sugar phosphate isomerase/epimerase
MQMDASRALLPFSLGLKLPLGWRDAVARGVLPAVSSDPYGLLATLGFGHVEFGTALALGQEESPTALVRAESAECCARGLAVALHLGPTGGEELAAAWFRGPGLPETAARTVARVAAAAAEASGGPVPVVMHPAQLALPPEAGSEESARARLAAASGAFFALAAGHAGCSGAEVRVVAEHQLPPDPGEPLLRVGDRPGELVELADAGGVGICWDTGHWLLAAARYGGALTPGADYLRRVAHVHLHDVVEGRDHRPVARGSGVLREFVGLLVERRFSGGVTLEYAPDVFMGGADIRALLQGSVEALVEWVGQVGRLRAPP